MELSLNRRRFLKVSAFSALGFGIGGMSQGCQHRSTASSSPPSEPFLCNSNGIAQDNITLLCSSSGTAGMASDYPNPFQDTTPNCILTCAQAQGPCYVPAMPDRQDISEGQPGLPLRLALQLVQANSCTPIPNAQVELWQTNAQGLYSGPTPAKLCYGRDPALAQAASQATFLRGRQTSNSQTSNSPGYLTFHSIYPGWYPGRTPHLHVKITIDGETFVITQLYFDDQLSQAIYQSHPDYRDRGPADTLNPQDGIFRRGNSTSLILQHKTMDDGSLLAYTTIGLRSSTDEPLCGQRPRQRQQSRSWNRTFIA